jgi:two-component system, OmpR family, response regulator
MSLDLRTAAPGILVVDDDPMLLGLLHTVLARQGFRVWTCAGGEEALTTYLRIQADIAVVLLDVCMPGLDGPATLAELRRIDPGVRACFMSGHTGAYSVEELLALGALRFFDKPFQIQPLAEGLWKLAVEGVRRSA